MLENVNTGPIDKTSSSCFCGFFTFLYEVFISAKYYVGPKTASLKQILIDTLIEDIIYIETF